MVHIKFNRTLSNGCILFSSAGILYKEFVILEAFMAKQTECRQHADFSCLAILMASCSGLKGQTYFIAVYSQVS